MADIYTHLAIAKLYLENNPGRNEIKNVRDFYDGNCLPDMCEFIEKEQTHCGKRTEETDLVKRVREKVDLHKFLETTTPDTDINRGKFLHLYADWVYYNDERVVEKIRHMDWAEYQKTLTYSTGFFDDYIPQKYGVSLSLTSMEKDLSMWLAKWKARRSEKLGISGNSFGGKLLYNRTEHEAFIELIARADLQLLAKRFRQSPA